MCKPQKTNGTNTSIMEVDSCSFFMPLDEIESSSTFLEVI